MAYAVAASVKKVKVLKIRHLMAKLVGWEGQDNLEELKHYSVLSSYQLGKV
jgi:hypothetical protein